MQFLTLQERALTPAWTRMIMYAICIIDMQEIIAPGLPYSENAVDVTEMSPVWSTSTRRQTSQVLGFRLRRCQVTPCQFVASSSIKTKETADTS